MTARVTILSVSHISNRVIKNCFQTRVNSIRCDNYEKKSAELTFLPCYSRTHWTIWKRWWNSMMPFPRSPIVPGNRPISRGIIAKIFQIDSSWEKNSGVTDKGGKSFPWNALSPSSCRSLRARGWRRARDPVRRLAKPTRPSPIFLVFLLSRDW